jgi:hypothetical protein
MVSGEGWDGINKEASTNAFQKAVSDLLPEYKIELEVLENEGHESHISLLDEVSDEEEFELTNKAQFDVDWVSDKVFLEATFWVHDEIATDV